MKFVWDLSEKQWYDYWDYLCDNIKSVREEDDFVNVVGVIGCCRVGDICFDIRGWGDHDRHALGYEMYVGGIDNDYNETKDGYPYDEVGYDEFGLLFKFMEMPLYLFKAAAEEKFRKAIYEWNTDYEHVDLMEKANQELHVW